MKQEEFKKNVRGMLSTQGLLLIISFISSVLMARWLGPYSRGKLSVATSIYMVGVQMGVLGLHSAHTYYISRDYNKLSVVLGNSVAISCCIGFFSTIVVTAIGITRPTIFQSDNLLLIVAALMIPVQLFWTFQGQTLLALNEVKVKNILDLFNAVLLLVSVAVIYYTISLSATKILIITLIVTVGIAVYIFRYICKKYVCKCSISWKFFLEVLPYGIKAHIACLLAYLLLRVDVFMINAFLGSEKAGLYSLAVSLADILSMVSSSVGILLFPVASAYGDDKQRLIFTEKVLKSVLWVLIPIAILLIMTVDYWLPFVYGDSYKEAIVAFKILIPGVVFWGVEGIIANFSASIKNFKIPIVAMTLSLLVNLILNTSFIPQYGINGAAMSSTISYGITLLIMGINFLHYRKVVNRC